MKKNTSSGPQRTTRASRDDIPGEPLDTERVRKARLGEIEYMEHLRVYETVPVEQSYRDTGRRPIYKRWLDINKGDSNRMELRSRFVACEIKSSQDLARVVRGDVFSGTPPHEAVRLLLSLAMTETGSGEDSKVLYVDISRARFPLSSSAHDLHRATRRTAC